MKRSAEIRGTHGLTKALRQLGDDVADDCEKVVHATALELRTNIVKGYHSGDKLGETYQLYNPRRTHQASAPDQPPASDTGRLASSVTYVTRKMRAVVETLVPYGAWLEWGTQTIAPRPHWRVEVKKIRPKLESRLKAVLRKAVSK